MASIRKIKTKWRAEVRLKGKYLCKTFLLRAEAKEWAHEQELRLGKSDGVISGKTLGAGIERYIKEKTGAKKGAIWEERRLRKIGRDKIADISLLRLKLEDFEGWIDRQVDLMPSSINRELNCISAVLTACRKWKWLDGNPLVGLQRPKDPPHRDRLITDEELERICLALGYDGGEVTTHRQRIAVSALLADETAMRQGEIYSLQVDDIFRREQYALLRDTKNGEQRKVPLTKKALKLIDSLGVTQGRLFPFPQASAGQIYRDAVKTAGVEGATYHDLRHRSVTRMAGKVDMLTLAKITGHKDPRMLMRYYNPTLASIADRLDET
jgi:integrase